MTRIPREEMIKYNEALSQICKEIAPDMLFSINGSFRRKHESSGDLDVLISGPPGKNKNYRDLFIKAMEETFLLSKKKNIKFDYNPVAVWIERISKMPRNLTSSMFIDFKKKKKLELDWLSGNVISMGREVSISCDAHNTILEGIKSK